MKNWSVTINQKNINEETNPSKVIGTESTLTLKNLNYKDQDSNKSIIQIEILKNSLLHEAVNDFISSFKFRVYPLNAIARDNYKFPIFISYYVDSENKFFVCCTGYLNVDKEIRAALNLIEETLKDFPFDQSTKDIINHFLELSPGLAQIYQEKLDQAKNLMNSTPDLANNLKTCCKIYQILSEAEFMPTDDEKAKVLYAEISQLKIFVLAPSLMQLKKSIDLDVSSKSEIEFYGKRKLLKPKIKALSDNMPIQNDEIKTIQIDEENNPSQSALNQVTSTINYAKFSIDKIKTSIIQAKPIIVNQIPTEQTNAKKRKISIFFSETRNSINDAKDSLHQARDSLNDATDALNDIRDEIYAQKDAKKFKK